PASRETTRTPHSLSPQEGARTHRSRSARSARVASAAARASAFSTTASAAEADPAAAVAEEVSGPPRPASRAAVVPVDSSEVAAASMGPDDPGTALCARPSAGAARAAMAHARPNARIGITGGRAPERGSGGQGSGAPLRYAGCAVTRNLEAVSSHGEVRRPGPERLDLPLGDLARKVRHLAAAEAARSE